MPNLTEAEYQRRLDAAVERGRVAERLRLHTQLRDQKRPRPSGMGVGIDTERHGFNCGIDAAIRLLGVAATPQPEEQA